MINRLRLGNICLYDLLLQFNDTIKRLYNGCIMEVLRGEKIECDKKCDKCLMDYLNKEA